MNGATRITNIAGRPYLSKNFSAVANDWPAKRAAKGFPNFFDKPKQMLAPIRIVTHESRPPQKGPKTSPLATIVTFAGKGATVACSIIRPAEIRTAQGP